MIRAVKSKRDHNLSKFIAVSLQRSALSIALFALLGSMFTSGGAVSGQVSSVSAAPGQPATQSQSLQVQRQLAKSPTNPSNGTAYYYNWSGYAATGNTPFNAVKSTFVQPTVTCTVPGAWTLFWVGFDGANNGSTVEQAGTAAQCSPGSNPQPIYYAWWEMWPTNNIQVMPITVKPGDTIEASVNYTASNASYSMNVTDKTNKQQSTQVATCAANLSCNRQSAEWIVERPTYNGSYTALANWGTMKLKSNQASNTLTTPRGRSPGKPVFQPISAFNNTPIAMINPSNGTNLASVNALNNNGNLFSDNWLAAQ
jgi:hypothetical protein